MRDLLTRSVMGVAVSADGRILALGSDDRPVRLWELQSGNRIAQMAMNAAIYCFALMPDGFTVVVGDSAGAERFIDIVGDR